MVTWSYSRQPRKEDKLPATSNWTNAFPDITVVSVYDTALANSLISDEVVKFCLGIAYGSNS